MSYVNYNLLMLLVASKIVGVSLDSHEKQYYFHTYICVPNTSVPWLNDFL